VGQGAGASEKSDFELVEIDSNHLKATALDMVFMVWRRETLTAPFRRGVSLVADLAQKARGSVGVCQIVEPDAVPPDAEARRAFLELLQLADVTHSSVIHDGTGFKAASVRAIVNLQTLLSKPKFPHLVFSTVKEAATWHVTMQRKVGRDVSVARLESVVRELRALHRARFP
jgi:hypothetical protein